MKNEYAEKLIESLLEDVDGLEDYVTDARTSAMSARLLTARLSRMMHTACMLRAIHETKALVKS